MKTIIRNPFPFIVAAAAGLTVGCASRSPEGFTTIPNLTEKIKQEFAERKVEPPLAGTERPAVPHTNPEIVASADLTFLTRRNPFALHGEEAAFENQIRAQAQLAKMSPTYTVLYPPPVPITPPEAVPVERQPYRRVAGVYFGDTVRAIVIMEDGQSRHVAPGDRIGEWTVKAISTEEVVLTREGKLPNEVRIRVESAPPGR